MAGSSTIGRIPDDSEHGRARRAGEKKEEREGVPSDGLPTAEEDLGGRIWPEKGAVALWFLAAAQDVACMGAPGQVKQEGNALG
jgi:hypothetical protein